MASNTNNTHHSASNHMFPYYPMYPTGLQYPDFPTTTPLQASSRFPTPELFEGQSQFIYNSGTAITPAFLADQQIPVPRNSYHATVCRARLDGAIYAPPAGLQQTFPISYGRFSDGYQDLSAAEPPDETQPPQIDLAGPPVYGSAELAHMVFEYMAEPPGYVSADREPALIELDNQEYATSMAETQPNRVRNPSSSPSTHDGLHRCPPDRKPSGTWRCSNEGCLRVFERKGSLKRHYRTAHFKTELLDCPVDGCLRVGDKGFTRSDNLRQHRRSKHGEDIPWVNVRLHGSSTVRKAR